MYRCNSWCLGPTSHSGVQKLTVIERPSLRTSLLIACTRILASREQVARSSYVRERVFCLCTLSKIYAGVALPFRVCFAMRLSDRVGAYKTAQLGTAQDSSRRRRRRRRCFQMYIKPPYDGCVDRTAVGIEPRDEPHSVEKVRSIGRLLLCAVFRSASVQSQSSESGSRAYVVRAGMQQ